MTLLPCFGIVWPGPYRTVPARGLACWRHADDQPHPSWPAWLRARALAGPASRRQTYRAHAGL